MYVSAFMRVAVYTNIHRLHWGYPRLIYSGTSLQRTPLGPSLLYTNIGYIGDPVYCTRANGVGKCFGREKYCMRVAVYTSIGYIGGILGFYSGTSLQRTPICSAVHEVSTSCVTTTTYKDRAADWAVNNGTYVACMQCIQYR